MALHFNDLKNSCGNDRCPLLAYDNGHHWCRYSGFKQRNSDVKDMCESGFYWNCINYRNAEYQRYTRELYEEEQPAGIFGISKIVAGIAIAAVLIVFIVCGVLYMNNPQREINQKSKEMYEIAWTEYKAGNYESSLNVLNSIDTAWKAYDKVNTLKDEISKELLREQASAYMECEDYAAIIKLAKNIENIELDSELKTIYDSAVTCFRNQVITEAKNEFTKNGYKAAIAIIDEGLSVLREDPLLQEEKDAYSQYAPVDLTSLTPKYEGYIKVFTDGATDNMGNHYSTGIRGYMDPSWDNCYNIWEISGNYNVLTATGIIMESEKDSECAGSYKIYGDGVLLYERNNITNQTKPYSIEVDITGITELKIEMYGNGNGGAYGMNSVLVNVTLQRTR